MRRILSAIAVLSCLCDLGTSPVMANRDGEERSEREANQRKANNEKKKARRVYEKQRDAERATNDALRELRGAGKRNGVELTEKEIAAVIKAAGKQSDAHVRADLHAIVGIKFGPAKVVEKVIQKGIEILIGRELENPLACDEAELHLPRCKKTREYLERKAAQQIKKEDEAIERLMEKAMRGSRDRHRGDIPRDSNERGDLNDHRTA